MVLQMLLMTLYPYYPDSGQRKYWLTQLRWKSRALRASQHRDNFFMLLSGNKASASSQSSFSRAFPPPDVLRDPVFLVDVISDRAKGHLFAVSLQISVTNHDSLVKQWTGKEVKSSLGCGWLLHLAFSVSCLLNFNLIMIRTESLKFSFF